MGNNGCRTLMLSCQNFLHIYSVAVFDVIVAAVVAAAVVHLSLCMILAIRSFYIFTQNLCHFLHYHFTLIIIN